VRPEFLGKGAQLLGLDSQNNRIDPKCTGVDCLVNRSKDGHAKALGQLIPLRRQFFDHAGNLDRRPLEKQTPHEGARHVSTADKAEAFTCSGL
jgi:hypothetical protein